MVIRVLMCEIVMCDGGDDGVCDWCVVLWWDLCVIVLICCDGIGVMCVMVCEDGVLMLWDMNCIVCDGDVEFVWEYVKENV